VGVSDFDGFLGALRKRHDEFHQLGARLSDHGLKYCYAEECSDEEAGHIFDKARRGEAGTEEEHSQFASYMMVFFGRLDAERGWTKQLHLGARRDANTRRMQELGPDTGFDSMGDWPQADALGKYLDKLESENALPRVIVYNSNPADNHAFATMIGNFQDGSVPGKAQFGSGWWFLDQKDGIEAQLKALCSVGLLSRFVGMLTDSRSFLSFPRHEYFRRVLCNLLGGEMERGELPQDWELVGDMVRNICFRNAERYFGLAMP
jgi:glucuronate isomerase